jgi:hypothetical protein
MWHAKQRLFAVIVVLLACTIADGHAHIPNLDENAPGGIAVHFEYLGVNPTTSVAVPLGDTSIELNGAEKFTLRVKAIVDHKPEACVDRRVTQNESGTRNIAVALTRRIFNRRKRAFIDQILGSEVPCGTWDCGSATGGSATCDFELQCSAGGFTIINKTATDLNRLDFKARLNLGTCVKSPNQFTPCNWIDHSVVVTGEHLTLRCKKKD